MRKGCCKHFNGSINDTCAAGVRYSDVTPRPNDAGCGLRVPCWSVIPFKNPTQVQLDAHAERGTCSKFEEPTDEEIAAHKKAMDEAMQRFMLTLPITAKVKKEHKGRDWKGTVECPACKGVLHLSHAAYNGHVWGHCETEGCVSWME